LTYQIAVSAGAGGTVEGGGAFEEGAAVTIKAVPNAGYSFSGWYENNIKIPGVSATYSFIATSDRTLAAAFAPSSIDTGGGSTGGGGSYTPSYASPSPFPTQVPSADSTKETDKPSGQDYTNPYNDIASAAWYYEAVKYVTQNSIMVGTGNGIFSPDATMTRAMFSQILYNYAKKPAIGGTSRYNDISASSWYFSAVTWATEQGIVSGYGNGIFGPEDKVSREQMAVLLYNYARSIGLDASAKSDLSNYDDAAKISAWARPAVQWAIAEEIIVGRTLKTVVPDGMATRAEAATIIMKFIENFIKVKRA
jgi:hypothetical protein